MGILYTILEPVMRTTRPVLPSYTVREIERELRIGIKHLLYSRRTRHQLVQLQGCRVNAGCGYNPTPGWINLDVNSSPGTHYWDCRRGLPFSENAVAAIFSEHMFEHFDLDTEAKPFLQECRRCLRPGGVIRLVVPDAGAYLGSYGQSWESFARIRPLYCVENRWKDKWEVYSTQMQLINYVFRQDYEHKYAYDEETLILILRNAGFSNIVRQSYGISLDSEMAPDREDRSSESLYVEAVK
jgi:predicted SAM-dependent methyltransferase